MTAPRDLTRFLVDLVEADAESHTPSTAARRLAQALARHTPLVGLVLGWGIRGEATARVAAAIGGERAGGWTIREARLDLSQSLAAALARGQAAPLGVRSLEGAFSHQARELGATRAVLLPLTDRAGAPGFALLYLRRPAAWILEDLALEGMAAVLRVAHRTSTLVTRVAAVSRQAFAENRRLRGELELAQRQPQLVAHSPAMRTALERVEAVARFSTTVLLRGESGSGKNVLARLLHAGSPRSQGPLVEVNCGALPEALVESELFGHERGAFTGADRRHRGAFERADGGTLVLDEVGDLPLPAQVKLLRVLQEGAFTPVGGEEPRAGDVRVVAATHRPLEEMVAAGRFREDLFYRLSVFPIHVPPLRERQEDLPALSEAIVEELGQRLELPDLRLSRAAVRKVLHHDWPGNVRELRNALERAAILARGQVVSAETLELDPAPRASARASAEVFTWEVANRRCIEAALGATQGRIYGEDGAAQLLGLKPTTLQTKMRRFGIARADFLARPSSAATPLGRGLPESDVC